MQGALSEVEAATIKKFWKNQKFKVSNLQSLSYGSKN